MKWLISDLLTVSLFCSVDCSSLPVCCWFKTGSSHVMQGDMWVCFRRILFLCELCSAHCVYCDTLLQSNILMLTALMMWFPLIRKTWSWRRKSCIKRVFAKTEAMWFKNNNTQRLKTLQFYCCNYKTAITSHKSHICPSIFDQMLVLWSSSTWWELHLWPKSYIYTIFMHVWKIHIL